MAQGALVLRGGFEIDVIEVRTDRGRQLLADRTNSVTQIAYRLGYSDVASFVRCFKARTGYTPTSFRKPARAPMGKRKGLT